MVVIFILYFLGLSLIYFEFFVPGMILGISGSVLLFLSLLFVLERQEILFSLGYLGIVFLTLFGVVHLALWQMKRKHLKGKFFSTQDQEGFQGASYRKDFVGKVGVVSSDLKPSGYIFVEKEYFQAISEEGYVEKGVLVVIVGGEGNHLNVRKVL